jgi:Lrp/AsnC family transcriptional regulator, regulator for asnA, asnC and gidA
MQYKFVAAFFSIKARKCVYNGIESTQSNLKGCFMPIREKYFDELDYAIIQALHADARIAASEIARTTGANERTIRKRIDRLVKENVIRTTAIIDPMAFGYVTAADIFLEVDPAREDEVIKTLMGMAEVTYIAYGQGTNDVSIEARFKDNDAFREFIRRTLANLAGVTVTRYTLVPRILRNIDEWMPSREDLGLGE